MMTFKYPNRYRQISKTVRRSFSKKIPGTAYDYVIYGSLVGRLLKISADTVYDQEQKKDFYRILVQTDKNYLEYKGKKLAIIPGIVVDVDILTGERTVLQYLMKPFIRGARESFSER